MNFQHIYVIITKTFLEVLLLIYYTGDIHGETRFIKHFILLNYLTENDLIVILGDAGLNYYGNDKGDSGRKRTLNKWNVPILCVHGNHEMRPESLATYSEKEWNGGTVYYEEEFPNILFAKDGEIYNIDGISHIALGGAYSVDKFYRLENGIKWFPDEQPSDEIKDRVKSKLDSVNWKVDVVLSHTCPFKYTPTETFLSFVDQSTVDTSTEHWLDDIEDKLDYGKWYCGHWHIDKSIDKLHFVMDDFVCPNQYE
ncbi:MAG: metallophosphoesterase [Clostridia bacterium]|nr:metallophosphoesterase [Clostridia bacterium]